MLLFVKKLLNCVLLFLDTPSRSNWDDDEDVTPLKHSSWDLLTPSEQGDRAGDSLFRSDRSDRSKHSGKRYKRS